MRRSSFLGCTSQLNKNSKEMPSLHPDLPTTKDCRTQHFTTNSYRAIKSQDNRRIILKWASATSSNPRTLAYPKRPKKKNRRSVSQCRLLRLHKRCKRMKRLLTRLRALSMQQAVPLRRIKDLILSQQLPQALTLQGPVLISPSSRIRNPVRLNKNHRRRRLRHYQNSQRQLLRKQLGRVRRRPREGRRRPREARGRRLRGMVRP